MKSLLPLFVIIICVVTYFFYISPTVTEVAALSAKSSEYKDVLSKSKELTQARDLKLNEYNNIFQEDVDRLNKIIPEEINAVVFVNEINAMAQRYGMSVRDLKINDSRTNTRDAIINQTEAEPYRTTTMTFKLLGQYNQFVGFLNDLESSLRLVDVTGLLMKSIGGRNLAESGMEFLLEVNTYSLR